VRLNVPNAGISKTTFGNILNTTMMAFNFWVENSSFILQFCGGFVTQFFTGGAFIF
jgi:hypothetical protein